jgi:hypothetical protein
MAAAAAAAARAASQAAEERKFIPFDGSRESYPDWKIKVHTKHVFLGNAD